LIVVTRQVQPGLGFNRQPSSRSLTYIFHLPYFIIHLILVVFKFIG
jgi:hypothetical protein